MQVLVPRPWASQPWTPQLNLARPETRPPVTEELLDRYLGLLLWLPKWLS